jgi:AbrB family looped-hinge helix DNA binding protein
MMAKIDEKGRVAIPKIARDKAGLDKGKYVKVKVVGRSVVIEAAEQLADSHFGSFKIKKWPSDLDDFLVEVTRKRWK